MAKNKDYYKILGVDRNCSDSELKSAYRKLAMKFHPDRNPSNNEAEDKFKEISEAYHVLSDKDLRHRYDTFGTVDDNFGSGGGMNAEDIFREFFKDRGFDPFDNFGFGNFGGFYQNTSQRQVSGTDKILRINVSMTDVYNNLSKTVKYTVNRHCCKCGGSGSKTNKTDVCQYCHGTGQTRIRQTSRYGYMEQITTCPHCNGTGISVEDPCPHCNGTGLEKVEETITVNVPTIDKVLQQTYSKKGSGNSAPNNLGENGDIRFTYKLNEDENTYVDKENALNIIMSVNVPIIDCLLGKELTVTNLDKKEYAVKIPQCTKDGEILRKKGKGFRHSNGNTGDLLIRINMVMPNAISEADKKLLLKLQKSKTFNRK